MPKGHLGRFIGSLIRGVNEKGTPRKLSTDHRKGADSRKEVLLGQILKQKFAHLAVASSIHVVFWCTHCLPLPLGKDVLELTVKTQQRHTPSRRKFHDYIAQM